MIPKNNSNEPEKAWFWDTNKTFYFNQGQIDGKGTLLHFHSEFELYMVTEGECKYFVDNKTYTLKDGDLVLTAPHILHKTSFDQPCICSRFLIYCDYSFVPESIQKFLQTFDYCVTNLSNSYVTAEDLLSKISYENEHPDEYSKDIIKGYLGSLLALIFRSQGVYRTTEIKSKQPFIYSAILFIKNNYSNTITLDDVAKHVAVSSVYLSRSFKSETGFTFKEYLTLYRLRQAETMLKQHPEKSILEISYECGFNDSNHFTTRFKKAYGITPSELRTGKTPQTKNYFIAL